MTVPIDIKKLANVSIVCGSERDNANTHPNVAPDPSMYCPRVRIGPFAPPPYLMIVKLPAEGFSLPP